MSPHLVGVGEESTLHGPHEVQEGPQSAHPGDPENLLNRLVQDWSAERGSDGSGGGSRDVSSAQRSASRRADCVAARGREVPVGRRARAPGRRCAGGAARVGTLLLEEAAVDERHEADGGVLPGDARDGEREGGARGQGHEGGPDGGSADVPACPRRRWCRDASASAQKRASVSGTLRAAAHGRSGFIRGSGEGQYRRGKRLWQPRNHLANSKTATAERGTSIKTKTMEKCATAVRA